MSLRTSEETTPLVRQPQQQPRLLQPSTGALYSDAIRLRPGATINGARPVAAAELGRRSFQEPFVPRRAPSTHAPNGGLDIDALVASAQTSLRMGHDEMEIAFQIQKIKQWFKEKTKKAKEKVKKLLGKTEEDAAAKEAKKAAARKQMMDAGIVRDDSSDSSDDDEERRQFLINNRGGISAAFDEVHAMVQQHALEVHGIDLATASESTRLLHVRVAEVLTGMQLRADDDVDTESIMKKAKEFKEWAKAKAKAAKDKIKKMMRKKKDGDESSSEDEDAPSGRLSLNEARDAMADAKATGMAFDSLGQVHTAASKAARARKKAAAAEKKRKANAALRLAKLVGIVQESSSDSEDDGEFVRYVNGVKQDPNNPVQIPFGNQVSFDEALHEARTMVEQHALEVKGIDLDSADEDTCALHAHMAEAIAHLHVATNGAAWEDDLDVGSPEWWGRHTNWAHEVETGAPSWWERKKQQAKDAMAKAKEAMGKASAKAKEMAGKASAKAKELKEKVANSSVGQMASKAKDAAMKFAKEKYARFTNEDRITKMERYDYELYVSQNPLTDVLIDKKQVTLPVGGDPKAEFYDPHTRAVEGKILSFYGLIATKQKDVLTNDLGDKAFNLAAKDSMKVLSIEKHRELFLATTPDPMVDPLSHVDQMTLGIKDAGTFLKRALAQGEAQHHAVPDKNNTSSMVFPSKPNGAHPLCLGHSMMVPVADVASGGNHLGLVRHLVPADWLKEVEAELVASPLRKNFSAMVSAEGADHKPFIIPVPSKYDEGSEAYKTAFEGSGAKPNETMRPVSALLVVPMTRETFDPMSGAFLMSGGEGKQEEDFLVEFAYERLYPYQPAPAAAKLQTYSDPSGERRKELNAKLVEKGPFDTYVNLKKAADELGYDATKTEPVTWHVSKYDVIDRYHVAVFALGLSPECDARGNPMACETAMDGAGSGKLLMIGTHPLIMGMRLTGETGQFDMEAPGSIYTSVGGDKPLMNALPMALEGKHIDLRFLWAGMKVAQRCFEKATNTRVSKPSLSRFRYLVGLNKELWQNADQKFGTKSFLDNAKDLLKKSDKAGSFQRRSTAAAFDDARFGQALEDLGLVHVTTGKQLKLHEMTEDELGQALQLAGIDLDSDED